MCIRDRLWISHPGERALYGKGRPSYWAGNGTLPRVNQYKGFATVFYDIAPEHPVDFTHLYLPTMEFYLCRVPCLMLVCVSVAKHARN